MRDRQLHCDIISQIKIQISQSITSQLPAARHPSVSSQRIACSCFVQNLIHILCPSRDHLFMTADELLMDTNSFLILFFEFVVVNESKAVFL